MASKEFSDTAHKVRVKDVDGKITVFGSCGPGVAMTEREAQDVVEWLGMALAGRNPKWRDDRMARWKAEEERQGASVVMKINRENGVLCVSHREEDMATHDPLRLVIARFQRFGVAVWWNQMPEFPWPGLEWAADADVSLATVDDVAGILGREAPHWFGSDESGRE